MERYAQGCPLPKEVRALRNGIFEIRVQADRCAVRLHFAHTSDSDGYIALALLVVNKKTQTADGHHIDRSLKRLADWEERQRAEER